MHIYFAAMRGFDPARAIAPGRGKSAGSAAAWSLLMYALKGVFALDSLPEIGVSAKGKPYFPALGGVRFSLSHTRGYVLCALSKREVGADVQLISEKDAPFAERLMSERERKDFTLHELWCLREAVYKLTGEGELRSMPFRREGELIVPPFEGVVCRLYGGIPGCAAAAAAYEGDALPEALEEMPVGKLQKGVVIQPVHLI